MLDEFEGTDTNDGFDVNDENRDATSIALVDTDGDLNNGDGTNAVPLNVDSDFREALDTDGDNVRDDQDIDDDNDGILDADEGLGELDGFTIGSETLSENGDGSGSIEIPVLDLSGVQAGTIVFDYFGFNGCLLYTSPSPRDS